MIFALYFLFFLYRSMNGLQMPVMDDPALCQIADLRMQEIKTDWSHDGFIKYIDTQTHKEGLYSENLAKNYFLSSSVLEAWIQSPSHNKILLSEMDSLCIREKDNYWVLEGFKK